MARFYPLYVRRSDGKIEVAGKGKRVELNQPTDEQMDQKPDKNGVSDYYREVPADETKHLDWRRKLGGMLARELEWKDKSGSGENGYILAAFPANYRLYEHIKKTEKDGKTEVKSKTHAAGGNDRQDAYLYGFPSGRKKRYRSPADFFPHLLWLCTDESGDPDNCSCKLCCPEDLEDTIPGAKATKVEKITEKQVNEETKPANPPVSNPVNSQIAQPKQPSMPTPASVSTPQQLLPTPLAQPRSTDQQIDRRYQSFMYRPGELVWFRRGQAWGLGIILRRWQTAPSQCHYTVQPLSHPFQHSAAVTKSADSDMRPWLAWSVPRFTFPGLNDLPNPPRYDTANWHGMAQKQYGEGGDLEVDGSILAAKSTDASYTLLGPHQSVQPEPGVTETYFDAMFLGAEKIWVGEPVRLAMGSGQDIMVVHSIIERTRTATMGQQVLQQIVQFVGDVYTLATVAHSDPTVPTLASPNSNTQLPTRLTEDLVFRNARSIHLKRQASHWKLLSTQSRIDMEMIKGRWYELSIIMPILQPDAFNNMVSKGEFQEASLWMNGRGDCQNANRSSDLPRVPWNSVRKATRREALGGAVPPDAEIKDGVDPPVTDQVRPALNSMQSNGKFDIDPRFETAQDVNRRTHAPQASQNGTRDAGLDQYMDLDGIGNQGNNMANFGRSYEGNAPGTGGFYG